jgi:hypothetical protein
MLLRWEYLCVVWKDYGNWYHFGSTRVFNVYLMLRSCVVILVYILFFGVRVYAQYIAAPSFNCVTNLFNGDVSLQWQPTAHTCITTGYEIYATNSLSGGFTLLTTTAANTYNYTHTNANGNNIVWYYYLKTATTCPTIPAIASDTLDNIDPLTPVIRRATVQNNQAVFEWAYGVSPETYAYIIYKKRQPPSSGFTIVDTLYGRYNNTYTDLASAPATQIEAYTIVAMDSCGNTGLISDYPHNTIWLRTYTDRCAPSVTLTWNKYNNWEQGVQQYEVFQTTNGSLPEKIATTTDTSYVVYAIEDASQVCWTVRAIEKLGSNTATSNEVCTTVNIVEPISSLLLTNTSFSPDNTRLVANWQWNPNADISSVGIVVGTNNTSSSIPITFPLQIINEADILLPNPLPPTTTAAWLVAADSCNTTTQSNTCFPPVLSAIVNSDPSITFRWTPYSNTHPNTQITSYALYRIENNTPVLVVALPSDASTYTHILDINNPNEANASYYLLAHTAVPLSSGVLTHALSRSNTLAIPVPPLLRLPNAIVPAGNNNCFKPLFVFPQNIQTYSLQIYNRWGGQVFSTTDPGQCWYGMLTSNAPVPAGTYAYTIRLTDVATPDKPIQYQGTVTVIR